MQNKCSVQSQLSNGTYYQMHCYTVISWKVCGDMWNFSTMSSQPEAFFLSRLTLCLDLGSNVTLSCIFTSQLVAYEDNQSRRIGWHAFADERCMRTVQIIMW